MALGVLVGGARVDDECAGAKKSTAAKKKKTVASKVKVSTAAKAKKAASKPKKLAVIKTKETKSSVEGFINKIASESQRKDSAVLVKMMQKVTKAQPKMWGSAIIGFGNLIYTSPNTGRQVEWFKIGFSPRKAALTLYLMLPAEKREPLLKKLGKFKTGGGCIYVNKLEDVDLKVLEEMLKEGAKKK